MGSAPVFLGAEDHPPLDRRPKCLTGSAITLVRLARPNPRGRHARVADPSGVECQRDGSDQGQRMEAGDGALTLYRSPAPSKDAHRSPALTPCWSPRIGRFRAGKEKRKAATDEYGRACPTPGNPWLQVKVPNPSGSTSCRPDWPSRKGSLPEWGETAWQAPVGTTRARSRVCRDVP
jgi:hypothetical protein